MRTFNIVANGGTFPSGMSFTAGESVTFNFTVKDPSTLQPIDLSLDTVVLSISKPAPGGGPTHPALINRQAGGAHLVQGICTASLAPTDSATFSPGQYTIELVTLFPSGERDQSLGFGVITIGATAFQIGDPITSPPPGGAGAPSPAGTYSVGIPTLWRGSNQGVSGGFGPTLDNSDPVLGAQSNDLQGDVTWTLDGNGATGTTHWTLYFSAPRGPVTVVLRPLDDFTTNTLAGNSGRHFSATVRTNTQGQAVGFDCDGDTLNANVADLHMGYTTIDSAPISIMAPASMQNFQQFAGVADPISVELTVSGTHDVEYSWIDNVWHLWQSAATGTVSGTISGLTVGFGPLKFRIADEPAVQASVQIGVGDNFVVGGDSQAVGQVAPGQDYTPNPGDALPSLFRLDNTWSTLRDPTGNNTGNPYQQPNNSTAYGSSIWMPFFAQLDAANSKFRSQGRALLNLGQDNATAATWSPGTNHFDTTTNYGSMLKRVQLMGGCAASLWAIFNNDVVPGTPASTAMTTFTAMLAAWRADLNALRAGMGDAHKVFVMLIPKITSGGVQQSAIDAYNDAIKALKPTVITDYADISALTIQDVVHITTIAEAQTAAAALVTVVKPAMGY